MAEVIFRSTPNSDRLPLEDFPDLSLVASESAKKSIGEDEDQGEGPKGISKAFDEPWSVAKAAVIKRRKWGASVASPRTGLPYKTDETSGRNRYYQGGR